MKGLEINWLQCRIRDIVPENLDIEDFGNYSLLFNDNGTKIFIYEGPELIYECEFKCKE